MQEVKGDCIQLSDRKKVADYIDRHLQVALDQVESQLLEASVKLN
jgi:hypothetical protein